MIRSSRTRSALLAAGVISVLTLAACGGSSSASSTSAAAATATATASPTASTTATTASGLKVTGTFGQAPSVTIPDRAVGSKVVTEVLQKGTGAVVKKGQVLVADYLLQAWDNTDGKANVIESSWTTGAKAAFKIGVGNLIAAWDDNMVGQTVGSRVVLTVPKKYGYGTKTSTSNSAAGHDLVFVVDIAGVLAGTETAHGTAQTANAAGFPKITSVPGKQPTIDSVAGVTVPTTAANSELLVAGDGAAIDSTKTLILNFIQTDTATGESTDSTWTDAPQAVLASSVISVVPALKGQKVGSRAVAVTPKTTSASSYTLVVDVIGQY